MAVPGYLLAAAVVVVAAFVLDAVLTMREGRPGRLLPRPLVGWAPALAGVAAAATSVAVVTAIGVPAGPRESLPAAAPLSLPSEPEWTEPAPALTEGLSSTPRPGSSGDPSPSRAGRITTEQARQGLGLAQAQSVQGEWEESRYEVADRTEVRAAGVTVDSCGDSPSNAPSLEYRLANRFKTLTFSASQANSSKSSNQLMNVLVEGNGTQLDIQKVPFNKVRQLKVPVDGVNALVIRLFLDESRCSTGFNDPEVTGLVEALTVA